MYYDIKQPVHDSWMFTVPFRAKPMMAKHIKRKFPDFAYEFDGSAHECCLKFYYTFNKHEKVFEFNDADAEDEVAELMNVQIVETEFDDEEHCESRALNQEEIADFKEQLVELKALIQLSRCG